MTYEQALNYIHSLNRFGIKPGLERITALLNKLNNPQNQLEYIHVAGTNGKGSTSTAFSNIMIASGKKTGLFISPFVVDFRERIQINGEYISKADLARLTEKVAELVPLVENELEDNITEFEFITAVMFTFFAEQKCDVVVLEVGLGGRLDSTNVIKKPLATVITKIALDHIAVLGDTIEKIALEKCGIIKCGSLVVTSALQNKTALEVIKNVAEEQNSRLVIADVSKVSNLILEPFSSQFNYNNVNVRVNLAGEHQVENMVTVINTALELGIPVNAIEKGVSKTVFPARLEVISKSPLVILDGAHNENGAEVLANYLDKHSLTPVTLLGMMADKNCSAVVQKIASRSSAVYTVKVNGNPRSQTAEELALLAKGFCAKVEAVTDYKTALEVAAKTAIEQNAPLLICGSLYLASDIRQMALNYFKK
ncbi:MAG: bifunctional folylpolyglutamate synthase/dihydrofolate synthase [Clostridia bacterium]|nr:bifunctional folylpolyglutamate synthase/dihydrofolate synthase [Clostridia bacterium]MBQ9919462.1 bifunctional folylpolyglutamate synthase/dihydrofolate synthase [Clostridia bacterium]